MYEVAKTKPVKRAKATEAYSTSNKTEHQLVVCPEFGKHKTNVAAKRSVVVSFDQSLEGCSDEHIKRVFKEYSSYLKIVKVAA